MPPAVTNRSAPFSKTSTLISCSLSRCPGSLCLRKWPPGFHLRPISKSERKRWHRPLPSGPTTTALRSEPYSCVFHSRERALAQPDFAEATGSPVSTKSDLCSGGITSLFDSVAAISVCPAGMAWLPTPQELKSRRDQPGQARPRHAERPAGHDIARPVDSEIDAAQADEDTD